MSLNRVFILLLLQLALTVRLSAQEAKDTQAYSADVGGKQVSSVKVNRTNTRGLVSRDELLRQAREAVPLHPNLPSEVVPRLPVDKVQ